MRSRPLHLAETREAGDLEGGSTQGKWKDTLSDREERGFPEAAGYLLSCHCQCMYPGMAEMTKLSSIPGSCLVLRRQGGVGLPGQRNAC